MPAGRMRSWLTVERMSKVSDGGGGFTVTWNSVNEVPAQVRAIRPSRNVEGETGGGRTSAPMFEVTIRADETFDDLLANAAGYRLRNAETNETFAVIAALDMDGRGREITISALKGTAA